MWTYRGPTVDIQARPKQATHVHIFFLLDLFFCRLHSFLYFCFSHAVKAQMFSNYPYAKWVSREVGSRGRRLVYWFRPGFVCHFGCASYFVYESFGPPPLSSSDFASRRHQSEPGLLLLPPFSFPADFVVSWRWLVDLRRWQLKGSGIKAEKKPSRRTISYNGKGLQELAEKTHFLARGLAVYLKNS